MSNVFAPSIAGALRQCEIITNYAQLVVDIAQLRQDVVEVTPIQHPYVVVLSQDCDLEQDFNRRNSGDRDNLLPSVILCAAAPADDDFRHDIGLNSNEWKKLKQNNDSRFHFLRAATAAQDAAAQGLSELVVDFRQYFAVPTEEVYFQIAAAVRRCRLQSPYLEHLSQRFFNHLARKIHE